MAKRLEGKQVNPVLLSATFDILMQAKVLVEENDDDD
jgi:hypothetical protein